VLHVAERDRCHTATDMVLLLLCSVSSTFLHHRHHHRRSIVIVLLTTAARANVNSDETLLLLGLHWIVYTLYVIVLHRSTDNVDISSATDRLT